MFFPSLHKGILATTVAWLFHFHIQSTAHLLCFFFFILILFLICLYFRSPQHGFMSYLFFPHCSFTFSPNSLLPLFPLFISASTEPHLHKTARSCFPCFPPPNSIPRQFSPHLSCFFIAEEASVKATCKRLNRQ